MLSIFGITVVVYFVVYFVNILNGYRNYWTHLRTTYPSYRCCVFYKNTQWLPQLQDLVQLDICRLAASLLTTCGGLAIITPNAYFYRRDDGNPI